MFLYSIRIRDNGPVFAEIFSRDVKKKIALSEWRIDSI